MKRESDLDALPRRVPSLRRTYAEKNSEIATLMTLTWETSYAIAIRLKDRHARANLDEVSLQQIYAWTLELEDFEDDPALCNDEILSSIYQEWFEELLND